ncbi:hypothetical protein AVEN_167869-1 [Araneus ventricosus]|uniref:Uncharacterized protein n=1 Tax=Araneus ventricosus TaxID=182803 RepID=A0A4Y2R3P8_ARAVE|nr:hypothetical protein AVEN_213752-1 [Araneus ventricosus]GBN69636.1 hypothetical protein AVEN_191649-1 [Araneus ventricosus]GBN69920.1 hypothetical protein AVEN_31827-1 [Araneus ventricosus]GBN69925.1 hypothetical protein AVEN_167869-1 [Araneus ventricosus]
MWMPQEKVQWFNRPQWFIEAKSDTHVPRWRLKQMGDLPLFMEDTAVSINDVYCSATDSETTTFGRFYTGKGCQAISQMSAFPEFTLRSRSVNCKHYPSILHFPPILMKITPPGACAKAWKVSESVAIQYQTRIVGWDCGSLPYCARNFSCTRVSDFVSMSQATH